MATGKNLSDFLLLEDCYSSGQPVRTFLGEIMIFSPSVQPLASEIKAVSLLPRHVRFRHRLHLLFGILDHLAGHVCGHLEDSAGELEAAL